MAIAGLLVVGAASIKAAAPIPASANDEPISHGISDEPTKMDARADKRYNEMIRKMQAAIEEIAQLYGNPTFLQVFTNDSERAIELKERLKAAQSTEDIQRELEGLERKRDDLLNDIALKTREATRLGERLARQKKALDALAEVFEEAESSPVNSKR